MANIILDFKYTDPYAFVHAVNPETNQEVMLDAGTFDVAKVTNGEIIQLVEGMKIEVDANTFKVINITKD